MSSIENINKVVEHLREWVAHTDSIENNLMQLDAFSGVLHENNISIVDDARLFLNGYDAATKSNDDNATSYAIRIHEMGLKILELTVKLETAQLHKEAHPVGIVESSVVWGVFNGEFMANVLTASREYAQEIATQQGGRVVAVALDPDALIPLTSKTPAYWDDGDNEAWPTRDQAVEWAEYGSVTPLYSGLSQKISQDEANGMDVHF
jgi:hypothetical protein